MGQPGQGTTVDFPGMKATAAEFGQGVNDIQRELQNFDSGIAALAPTWGGHTADTFYGFTRELVPQFRRIIKALDTMKDTLNGTEAHYSRNEYDAVNFVSPLASDLGGVFPT